MQTHIEKEDFEHAINIGMKFEQLKRDLQILHEEGE